MIKEQNARTETVEVCRHSGLHPAKFYELTTKCCGMDLSDPHRPKTLEDENDKLTRLWADSVLDNTVLKELVGKALSTTRLPR
ncbi:MAG: hypothetical protein DI498_14145 [Paracoccus denitrificans]|nr:MAG: hypothetical protein DI498_14145 [Paracoccus denitrificans]PZO82805.1 MAG: hypothetical protein DI633_14145 [Paracoccus denitrificans]